jgi:hypothetical protein
VLETVPEIDNLLSELGSVFLTVREYQLTHSRLHIWLTKRDIHNRIADIHMGDCLYISGPLQGGPWQLRATEVVVDNQKAIKISETTGLFTVTGLRVRVTRADKS